MKLYLIHAGYYNPEIVAGLYEQHTNYFVAAENVAVAKKKALENPTYQKNKMHIDGIQEINAVDGYSIKLVEDNSADDMVIYDYNHVKNIK
jgi:hypothetical protein